MTMLFEDTVLCCIHGEGGEGRKHAALQIDIFPRLTHFSQEGDHHAERCRPRQEDKGVVCGKAFHLIFNLLFSFKAAFSVEEYDRGTLLRTLDSRAL